MFARALSGFVYSTTTSHGVASASAVEACIGQTRSGTPTTSPRFRHACVRDAAATSEISDTPAIARASSEPAHPVAPARHTLVAIALVPFTETLDVRQPR